MPSSSLKAPLAGRKKKPVKFRDGQVAEASGDVLINGASHCSSNTRYAARFNAASFLDCKTIKTHASWPVILVNSWARV